MQQSIIEQLKKISFKRDKKDPTISNNDLSHLNSVVNENITELINNECSRLTSELEVKNALTARAVQISQMKDKYKSYSAKDTYSQFLTNLIEAHLNIAKNI